MLTFAWSIVAFVFVIGVLIVLHEAGHFLAARAVGAQVEVFSVGFGKRLWGVERGDTDYRLSAIPVGGYVRIVGLGMDESDVVGATEGETVQLLPRYQRALILLAGPITNVIAAFGFLAFTYMIGAQVPAFHDEPPVVGWISPESPASEVDLKPGDLITMIDDQPVEIWRDLEMSLITSGGHEVELEVERGGQVHQVTLTPEKVGRYDFGYSGILPPLVPEVTGTLPRSPAKKAGILAGDRITAINNQPVNQFYDLIRLISPHANEQISVELLRGGRLLTLPVTPGSDGKVGIPLPFPMTIKKLSFIPALKAGADEVVRMTRETFRIIGRLLTGQTSIRQVSGPIEIARISGEAARSGFRQLIWLMGVISLQLGIFNLLPIPILDGGHLTILGLEGTIRRDLSDRIKEKILYVGFGLLLVLMVVVFANDIWKNVPQKVVEFFK